MNIKDKEGKGKIYFFEISKFQITFLSFIPALSLICSRSMVHRFKPITTDEVGDGKEEDD